MPQPKELRQQCAAQVFDRRYPDSRGFLGAHRQCYKWAVGSRQAWGSDHEIPVCGQHLRCKLAPVAYEANRARGAQQA